MQADLDDVNFMRGMATLTNMQPDEIEKLIDSVER